MGALVLLLTLTFLAACGAERSRSDSGHSAVSPALAASAQTYVYECADGNRITVRIEGETAWLFLASGTIGLPHVVSASGARFSDGATSYWNKGSEAVFVWDGQTSADCRNNRARAIWEDARLRGADFRAVGNEPGWQLEIFDKEKGLFDHNYGQESHEFQVSASMVDASPRATRYELRNDAHRLSIKLDARQCSDSMSGESFQTAAWLMFDGKAFFGCGKALH